MCEWMCHGARCIYMYIYIYGTAFNGPHTAVLSGDQLCSTPKGSTLHVCFALLSHHHITGQTAKSQVLHTPYSNSIVAIWETVQETGGALETPSPRSWLAAMTPIHMQGGPCDRPIVEPSGQLFIGPS